MENSLITVNTFSRMFRAIPRTEKSKCTGSRGFGDHLKSAASTGDKMPDVEQDVDWSKALGEEYARRYPNLVTSPEAGEFYASLEIRGMAQRGANGIITTHPDNISYNDNSDPKKNWSAMIDENTWNLLLSWLNNHTINTEEMTGFKYWDNIFNEIGGSYERVWSDDEIRQGHLYQ